MKSVPPGDKIADKILDRKFNEISISDRNVKNLCFFTFPPKTLKSSS